MNITQRKPERIKDLIDKELPPVLSWIGEGVLTKRGTMLLGGPEKIGKSFYGLEMARALTTGDNVFGHPQLHTQICRVLYIEQEVGELHWQKRSREVMKHEDPEVYGDRLWYMSQVPEMKLDTSAGKKLLFEALEAVQANVCILDPIKNMSSYDENSNTDIASLFATLDSLKSSFIHNDLAFVIMHHMRKPPTGEGKSSYDVLDMKNFRGANNWTASPDSIMTVHRNRELNLGYTAWETMNRIVLRNDNGMSDWRMTVNRDNDLRVRFDSVKGGVLPLKKEPEKPLPGTLKGTQERLGFQGD
jgi:hypothetical protein